LIWWFIPIYLFLSDSAAPAASSIASEKPPAITSAAVEDNSEDAYPASSVKKIQLNPTG
jgi:hypothetical protein